MRYIFGDYTLHPDRYELRYHNARIPLEPHVCEVLAYLVQHGDRVVSKQELLERLWPQRYVSDKALVRCIQKARQALNDHARQPQLIQTIYGRGYRFIGGRQLDTPRPPVAESPLAPQALISPPDSPGHQAIGQALLPPVRLTLSDALEGERKQVTVVVGEIDNAVGLVEQLGEETMCQVIQALLNLAQQVIQRYEGTLTTNRKHGFMALLGAPLAHEDHARRAVRAALDIVGELPGHATLLALSLPVRPTVRMGLHTGWVVVGPFVEEQQRPNLAMSHVMQQAEHLQQSAGPGSILVSATTARLVQHEIHLEPWGYVSTRSQVDVVGAYRVLAARTRSWPWTKASGYAHRPFVGRAHELTLLHQGLERMAGKAGQAIGVVGEPGLGKSRLLYEFVHSLQGQRVTCLVGRCLSYGNTTPYLPIRDLLRQACAIREMDPPESIIAKLQQHVREVGLDPEPLVPYLLHVLGVNPGTERLAEVSATIRQSRTFAALWQLFLASSSNQPLILAIEDLQWIDATSEACLTFLVERLAGASIFCLHTHRPGYTPPWLRCSFATQLALAPLTPHDSARVMQHASRAQALPNAVAQRILATAQGNPLFLEELSRAVLDQGQQHGPFVLPDTIQAILAARMDRLPPAAKYVLQAAAVIGREVPHTLLQASMAWPLETIAQHLHTLQAAEFLYETSLISEPVYTFKHALTQEVAYQSLLPNTRQRYHAQVAQVLGERFPETVEAQPERVAHHYTEAGLAAQAVPYWHRAGQHAVERYANPEATSHLCRGLALLTTLPDTPARAYQELLLQTTLGQVFLAAKGLTSAEVERTYSRARVLCQQVQDPSRLFPVLVGLRGFYEGRGELQTARELGEQLLTLAHSAADPTLLVSAHRAHGGTLFWLGEFPQARAHLEQGMALYAPQQHNATARRYQSQHASMVSCLRIVAVTLWYLGYPDQALQRSREACTLARQLAHPFHLAYALYYAAWVHSLRREALAAQEQVEATLALACQHEFPHLVAMGTFLRGWTLVAQGHYTAGLAQMHQGVMAYQAEGCTILQPSLLAEAYGLRDQIAAGLHTVAEGLAGIHTRGGRCCEAELHRLKGELVLRQSHADEAEAETCLRQALAVARRQQARSLELRAAVSLARLWDCQGKGALARQMLEACTRWFSEGFDTSDIREAHAMLDTLR